MMLENKCILVLKLHKCNIFFQFFAVFTNNAQEFRKPLSKCFVSLCGTFPRAKRGALKRLTADIKILKEYKM